MLLQFALFHYVFMTEQYSIVCIYIYIYTYIYHNFINLSFNGHLGYFHDLAIVNNAL